MPQEQTCLLSCPALSPATRTVPRPEYVLQKYLLNDLVKSSEVK